MLDPVAAVPPQTEHGDGIGHVQQRDARSHHAVERSRRTQIQQAQGADDEAAHAVRDQRHVERVVHLRQPLVAGQAAVACKRPAQAGLPGVAGDLAAHARDNKQGFQHDGAGLVAQGLVVEVQDGHAGRRVDQLIQVLDTEEHRDAVRPRSHEPDAHRRHDGDRDVFLRLRDFLGQMRRRVETGEDPVRVDQPDDEGHAIRRPPGRIDEVAEDVLRAGVGVGAGGHRDQDHQVGDQGDVQGRLCDGGERLADAVEEEAEEVDQLVRDDDVPGLDFTIANVLASTSIHGEDYRAYKSGWPSCHMPTTPSPKPRTTLEHAKIAPA